MTSVNDQIIGTPIFVDDGNYSQPFKDEKIEVSWVFKPTFLGFRLVNKSQETVKILWDDSSLIDWEGGSNRVMHGGVKFIARDQPQPPSVVAKDSQIQEMVIPTSNVYWNEFTKAWDVRDLIQTVPEQVVGKNLKILLSLQIGDEKREYVFVLKVTSVESRIRWT